MEKVTERVLFCLVVIGIIWKLLLKVKRIYGLSGNKMPLELKIITRLLLIS